MWLGLTGLILANALYVAAEFGAVSVRRSRVRRLADDGGWLARRLVPFIEHPAALDRYVGASQIGITLSSLMLGAFAQATVTPVLAPALGSLFALEPGLAASWASVLVLTTLTALQLVVGELVPKALALQYPTETALATVLPMQWSATLFRPLLAVLNGTATALLRSVGAKATSHGHLHSPEELELLIAESRDGGLLEPEEQQRLHRALRLGLRQARDLMVKRDALTTLPIDAPWDVVVATVHASPYSRIPVYRGSPDAIVGTLRVKDLIRHYVAEGPRPLEGLVRPLIQLPESLAADRVLSQLRENRAHQAVVVDDGGRAVGVITIQDVVGALLGPGAVVAGAGPA